MNITRFQQVAVELLPSRCARHVIGSVGSVAALGGDVDEAVRDAVKALQVPRGGGAPLWRPLDADALVQELIAALAA